MPWKTATLLCSFAAPCFACYQTPAEQVVAHDELISRTTNIVLARVVNAEVRDGFRVRYTLDVQQRLAGTVNGRFEVEGLTMTTESGQRSFNNHADPNFWKPFMGRLANDTDCKIYPTFSVGATYLLFLDKPYHRKSFELIIRTGGDASRKDKWLSYVQTALGRKGRNVARADK